MRKGIFLYIFLCMPMILCNQGLVHADQEKDCDMNKGPCSIRMEDIEVTLDIGPKPVTAMNALTFTVDIKGVTTGESLKIDLSMPGMYMGKNVVTAKKDASGKFTGTGIIPGCASGRTLWQAKIPVEDKGSAIFKFNVAY